ncbi:hypothetical protein ACIQMR_14400 [Streptomyces sp. NPDC091376]|uniref:hypothetical protein n=1 Tax=Streptomyces sp. NPDC091376 TaxID=3365994 RepID=UPI003828D441
MKLAKSVISHNSTTSGSGGGVFSSGTLDVEDSSVSHNVSANDGGGIFHNPGTLSLRMSTISDNTTADDGGGLDLNGNAVIEDSKITNNTAGDDGGGMFIPSGGNHVAVRDTKILRNRAVGSDSQGGGIILFGGSFLTLTETDVQDNTAVLPAGGIQNSGTVTPYGKVRVTGNEPTNCQGSSVSVPGCLD